MKRLLLLLIFASTFSAAQDLDDSQESNSPSEASKNFFRVDIKKPFDHYKVTSCADDSQFIRAQFAGGDAAFSKELLKYISDYFDKETYVVNGIFFLHMDISKDGKATGIDITPKVENSESFLRDLKFAVKKIKNRWTPSKCNNVPVDSRIRIELNFDTENVDL